MKPSATLFWLATLVVACICAPATRVETDPELTGGYTEGDMELDMNRNGLTDTTLHWPNGIVYYRIADGYFDDAHRNHILVGMRLLEEVSCIRFKEAAPDALNFVNITGKSDGCHSSVGWENKIRSYNLQIYPLDEGCFRLGTIVHEFLHTLGFYHMQSSPDRDDYVEIREENIRPTSIHNFNKYSDDKVEHYDSEYDYGSVMHYSAYAFSINGEKTIVALKPEGDKVMGQRRSMSASDIVKLNVMYRCPLRV